jgi:hypothetical protein
VAWREWPVASAWRAMRGGVMASAFQRGRGAHPGGAITANPRTRAPWPWQACREPCRSRLASVGRGQPHRPPRERVEGPSAGDGRGRRVVVRHDHSGRAWGRPGADWRAWREHHPHGRGRSWRATGEGDHTDPHQARAGSRQRATGERGRVSCAMAVAGVQGAVQEPTGDGWRGRVKRWRGCETRKPMQKKKIRLTGASDSRGGRWPRLSVFFLLAVQAVSSLRVSGERFTRR